MEATPGIEPGYRALQEPGRDAKHLVDTNFEGSSTRPGRAQGACLGRGKRVISGGPSAIPQCVCARGDAADRAREPSASADGAGRRRQRPQSTATSSGRRPAGRCHRLRAGSDRATGSGRSFPSHRRCRGPAGSYGPEPTGPTPSRSRPACRSSAGPVDQLWHARRQDELGTGIWVRRRRHSPNAVHHLLQHKTLGAEARAMSAQLATEHGTPHSPRRDRTLPVLRLTAASLVTRIGTADARGSKRAAPTRRVAPSTNRRSRTRCSGIIPVLSGRCDARSLRERGGPDRPRARDDQKPETCSSGSWVPSGSPDQSRVPAATSAA